MRGILWHAGLVFVTLGLAAATSEGSHPASATTEPGDHIYVPVQITRTRIAMWNPGVEPRGLEITFHVVNKDTKAHNFSFLGKTTPPLRQGKSAELDVFLDYRGKFLYQSTINPSRRLKGYFTVI
jgi:hypothetical protein